jgi:hypothetical protein
MQLYIHPVVASNIGVLEVCFVTLLTVLILILLLLLVEECYIIWNQFNTVSIREKAILF